MPPVRSRSLTMPTHARSLCRCTRRCGTRTRTASRRRWARSPRPMRASSGRPRLAADRRVNRAIDLFLALLGWSLLWPLLALLAVLIRLESPGGPVFRQQRVGLNGRRFTIYKLRTMRPQAPAGDLTVEDFDTFLFT